jgi:hypothetical protein
MLIEQLLNDVETQVAGRYKRGYPREVGEIYLLTDEGLTRLVFASKSKAESARKLDAYIKMTEAMTKAGHVQGVVQVASAWMSTSQTAEDLNVPPSKDPDRKEVLVFNGSNSEGNRVRVYEMVTQKGKRVIARMTGAYNTMRLRRVDNEGNPEE